LQFDRFPAMLPITADRHYSREGSAMRLSQFFSSGRSSRSAQSVEAAFTTSEHDLRPTDSQLDLFGLTHPGKVRTENQDHFLVGTVHPEVIVHGTSLADMDRLPLRGQRLATMLLVADGVGGQEGGSEASRLATEAITAYVSSTLRCYHTAGTSSDQVFLDALRAAALKAHETVSVESAIRGDIRMATTLTLGIVVWPWLYVVQVGDSRAYLCCNGALRQVTRDQTMAQDLVDQGVLPAERVSESPFNHVLSSAIGGSAAVPVVTRIDIRGVSPVVLLCSDGLTKHVSDREIEQHILGIQSSEQLCRALLELALERGGSDNITLVVGRAKTSAPVS
jgi:serine/threonine protein phosphatase PrpC